MSERKISTSVSFTEKILDEVDQCAYDDKKNRSEWIRDVVLKEMEKRKLAKQIKHG